MPFRIGDHVMLISDEAGEDFDSGLHAGNTGVIADISQYGAPPIGVRWDDFSYGHTCGSHCEEGRGWYVYPEEIALAYEPIDESFDISSIL